MSEFNKAVDDIKKEKFSSVEAHTSQSNLNCCGEICALGLFCILVILLVTFMITLCFGINIASIIIGAIYDDVATVCSINSIAFNLAQWVLYSGIIGLVANLSVCCCSLFIFSSKDDDKPSMWKVIRSILSGCMALFWVAWFISGVVLIASVPELCRITYGNTVYTMAVILLCCMACAICGNIMTICNDNKSDN